jgi:ribonuclease HI
VNVLDPRAIQIHTDGSCYMHRGRIAGCAAIVVYPEHLGLPDSQIVDHGCAENTNIRMELMACAKGLSWALENEPWDGVTRIYIVTDLLFLANNHGNAQYWKKNGWRSSSGVPIAHEDLWDEILKSIAKLSKRGSRVDFHYSKGKSDEIGKKVHKAATVAAERGGFDRDFGFMPGSYSRSMVPGGAAALRFPAAGQTLVIRPYMKRPRKKREEMLAFNVFDEVSQSYAGKFFAYAEPSSSLELHKGNGHRVLFNSDAAFPQILQRIEGVQLPKPARKKRTKISAP